MNTRNNCKKKKNRISKENSFSLSTFLGKACDAIHHRIGNPHDAYIHVHRTCLGRVGRRNPSGERERQWKPYPNDKSNNVMEHLFHFHFPTSHPSNSENSFQRRLVDNDLFNSSLSFISTHRNAPLNFPSSLHAEPPAKERAARSSLDKILQGWKLRAKFPPGISDGIRRRKVTGPDSWRAQSRLCGSWISASNCPSVSSTSVSSARAIEPRGSCAAFLNQRNNSSGALSRSLAPRGFQECGD